MEWKQKLLFLVLLFIILVTPDDSRSDDAAEEGGLGVQPDPIRDDPLQAPEVGAGNKGERRSFKALDREIKRLERTKSEFVTTSVQERRQHAAEAIEEILQKVDEEMAFMGQRASSGPAREKRFLAAVIAAASAIFSFGLGISTEWNSRI
jgi:hypothetical protein